MVLNNKIIKLVFEIYFTLFILFYFLSIYSINIHLFFQISDFLFYIAIVLIQLPTILKTKELNNFNINLS